jgi:hypothetical protein
MKDDDPAPATESRLFKMAEKAWKEIPQAVIDEFVLSFEVKLRKVAREE